VEFRFLWDDSSRERRVAIYYVYSRMCILTFFNVFLDVFVTYSFFFYAFNNVHL